LVDQTTGLAVPAGRSPADFWKFWGGQTLSQLGSSFTTFALPLIVFKQTGSALDLGIAAAVNILPYLLFGLVLGAWVDRVDRKRLMILADVGRALVIGVIPVLWWLGAMEVWCIYVVGFLTATLTIVFEAGEFAALPSLVSSEDLVTANGRIQATYSGAAVLGPVLAGVLVAFMSVPALLLLDALTFVASAVSLVLVRARFNPEEEPGGEERPSILEDVREGLRYVLGHPVLRGIAVMMALVNLVAASVHAQLVLLAKERLQATDTEVGWLYAAGSLGMVVLSLAAGPLRRRLSFSTVALGALAGYGLLTVALGATRTYPLALVVWGAASGLAVLFNVAAGSLRQSIVPNELLGRVMTVSTVLAWSAIPVGTTLSGALIESTRDVALVYGAIGLITLLIPAGFAFTAVGRAEQYLRPQEDAAPGVAAPR
jgi:MFS family permease